MSRPITARKRWWIAGGVCIVALLAQSGCSDLFAGDEKEVVYRAPVHSRAMWVLEPATIRIGDVATLEVAVVTRPDHRVLPFATPDQVAGLWILEVETLPVTKETNRWIHRTRVRIRPREVGRFDWPSTPIEVEGDGVVENLIADGLTIEVQSVVPEYVGKLTPFGLGPLDTEAGGRNPWIWAVGGAGFTLGCVGLLWLARRESNKPAPPTKSRSHGTPSWETALGVIEEALVEIERDPISACAKASSALRTYMDRRFGAGKPSLPGADVDPIVHFGRAVACTTDELERAKPPFAATSRWPRFVALLRQLDRVQFAAPASAASPHTAAREAIREVASFVRDTIPNQVAR